MWTTLLIGVALGACWACGVIFGTCEVQTKENCKADRELRMAVCMRVFQLEAENARFRLALAAGEMTGDGKKIATMAIAALNAVITAARERFEEIDRSPATSQEPARSLNAAE